MIDTHAHVDTRPYEDFESMAISGITDILTLAHDPMKMSSSVVFKDHFERLFDERSRAGKNGIRLHVCLGIHPRTRPDNPEECLDLLESYLKGNEDREVIAIGEAGLETVNSMEAGMLQRQIELAIKYDKVIIVHTPRSGKGLVTREIMNILSTFSIKKDSVVVDHIDKDTIKTVLDRGYNAGLTVQPGKLTPSEAASIVKEYDSSRMVLNTDMSSNPTDVLGIPRTVHTLRMMKVDEDIIAGVSELNARRIFNIRR